ncbi:MAG: PEP-CTERM system histidine kinase PrsK [Sphingomonas sp.]|uniref:XrtA/PEP-CTERM system histidine kinase PrsK n=1 Tax=Sphingomonas sp. TaxID=28214 RepID=UPI001AD2EC40|nr:XrtA/PEP-CTERM system histidine kinase PrsK [Sphingomonas sp.]MBN8808140.1 PEP-CTERM system histidine kinase PrsK [Sphingomonas sp.]
MIPTIVLWSHAFAALLFAGIGVAQLRGRGASVPRTAFLAALALTSLWALAIAGIGTSEAITWVAESLRNLGWLGFMLALIRHDWQARSDRGVLTIYGVLALVALTGAVLAIAYPATGADAAHGTVVVRVLLRMMVAVGALVLVNHLYSLVAPAARGGIRVAVVALATMWGSDLVLYAIAYVGGHWSPVLVAVRGLVMVAVAPMLAIAVHCNGNWTLHLSRTVAWRSLSAIALAVYAMTTVVAISAIDLFGGDYARIGQTAFVVGSAAALLTLLSSPGIKAWAKVMLAKHLFRHRYDYRAEWIRFTETLGLPGEDAPGLEERVVKAVADLTDSPAGLLLVADGGGLTPGAGWRWDGVPPAATGDALAAILAGGSHIVELDSVRAGRAEPAELAAVPQWMVDDAAAWAVVPLVHLDRLVGAILLARPPIDRSLDWEDFDLLRIAGRQVASYLAEARGRDQLADARRFDEFNRRFAFILHDVKNLVSQLTLVARNAERHADNPAFRADMIATLKASAGRMNDLLARLSQHHSGRADEPSAVALMPLVERVAKARGNGQAVIVAGDRAAFALADPARLEQALGHLIQNAVEASGADPVTVTVAAHNVTVADRGCGMSAAFVRDELFRPFVSTKSGGFGIGAFEARQLILGMGGTLTVASREGEGTRFTIMLPAAHPTTLEQAA